MRLSLLKLEEVLSVIVLLKTSPFLEKKVSILKTFELTPSLINREVFESFKKINEK